MGAKRAEAAALSKSFISNKLKRIPYAACVASRNGARLGSARLAPK
jgi:hypothetical protein